MYGAMLFAVAAAAGTGCGHRDAQESAAGRLLEDGLPAELSGARLLYVSQGNVLLRDPVGAPPRLAVQDGAWPRWSPDGRTFLFIRDGSVWLYDTGPDTERLLAGSVGAIAAAYDPDGNAVWYSDRKAVYRIELSDNSVRRVLPDVHVLELDPGEDGIMAVTERRLGYRVSLYAMADGRRKDIRRGCSAGLSPGGDLVMVNLDGHTALALHDTRTGAESRVLTAPEGCRLDNQYWSNDPDWIAAVATQGEGARIVVQRVRDSRAWAVTGEGDFDRPDLYVPQ